MGGASSQGTEVGGARREGQGVEVGTVHEGGMPSDKPEKLSEERETKEEKVCAYLRSEE